MGLVECIHFIFVATDSDVTLCTSFIRDTESLASMLPKEPAETFLFIHQKQRGENRCLELTLKNSIPGVLCAATARGNILMSFYFMQDQ